MPKYTCGPEATGAEATNQRWVLSLINPFHQLPGIDVPQSFSLRSPRIFNVQDCQQDYCVSCSSRYKPLSHDCWGPPFIRCMKEHVLLLAFLQHLSDTVYRFFFLIRAVLHVWSCPVFETFITFLFSFLTWFLSPVNSSLRFHTLPICFVVEGVSYIELNLIPFDQTSLGWFHSFSFLHSSVVSTQINIQIIYSTDIFCPFRILLISQKC